MRITQKTSYEERKVRNKVYTDGGTPAMTLDAAAQLTAILYMYGHMGDFMKSGKLRADYEWIIATYHVDDADKMPEDFAKKYAEHVGRLQRANGISSWAEAFLERYFIEL